MKSKDDLKPDPIEYVTIPWEKVSVKDLYDEDDLANILSLILEHLNLEVERTSVRAKRIRDGMVGRILMSKDWRLVGKK